MPNKLQFTFKETDFSFKLDQTDQKYNLPWQRKIPKLTITVYILIGALALKVKKLKKQPSFKKYQSFAHQKVQ